MNHFIKITTYDGEVIVNKSLVTNIQYFAKTDYTAIELSSGTTLRAAGDLRGLFV
jgi:hypothetical protein